MDHARREKEKVDYKKVLKSYQEDCNVYEPGNSAVSKFFAGRFVFVTGGTGFLGKLTIEKLLRACPDVNGIFMLVRSKKGKDVHTRIDEIFNDGIFERLGSRHPKFRYKIIPVAGDVGLPGLGLRIEDRKVIIDKVSVIFHVAATVRFDEKLNIANNINVKGTAEILTLARECANLVSFVHVSTAFSHCPRKEIDEVFYESPISPEKLGQICDSVSGDILDKITPDLVGNWPNTYAFTKAVAEDVVRKMGKNMPVCVFRPSIVLSTYKEPVKGWIDNVYGPTGYFLGCGIGLLRTLRANPQAIADVVPADLVVNGLIAASYQTAIQKPEAPESIKIYNYVSSVQQPITWRDYCEWSKKYGVEFGPMKAIWYHNLLMIQSETLYLLYAFLVHTIPAFFVDLVTILIGKKPQMLKIYKKIHKFSEVLAYFGTRKWKFSNDNVQSLGVTLNEDDKRVFNCDMKTVDWMEFMESYGLGVRQYILKEPLSSIDSGRKRYKRLKMMHYTLLIVLLILGLNILYKFLSYAFGYIS